ncbi:MAG: hypothetical protein GF364_03410 [Candidatus Lokiarchaeota archaeon]|nr:hypothetical protein [Candidatus Lokiarchaeota archaeon]
MESLNSLDLTLGEQMQHLIDKIFKNAKYKALVVANEDGFPIASKIKVKEEGIEELISALFNTMLTTETRISEKLAMGKPKDILFTLEKGTIVVNVLENKLCCGMILQNSVNIPFYKFKLEELSEAILEILNPE